MRASRTERVTSPTRRESEISHISSTTSSGSPSASYPTITARPAARLVVGTTYVFASTSSLTCAAVGTMFLLLASSTTSEDPASSTAPARSAALGISPCPPSITTAPICSKRAPLPSPRLAGADLGLHVIDFHAGQAAEAARVGEGTAWVLRVRVDLDDVGQGDHEDAPAR